jgi:hypothetical protein
MSAGPQTRQATRRGGPARGGFALIEVLVSLTLLAVGIVGVLTAVLSALDLQQDTDLRYRAALILQDKLEEVSFAPYGGEVARGVSADGRFSWTIIGTPWQGMPTGDDRGREAADEEEIGIYEVRVEVSWETTRGTRRLSATQLASVVPQPEDLP